MPLVIGMQLSARTDAALRASSVIYASLIAGYSLQDAVNRARQALFVEEEDHASWYVPVLYINTSGPARIVSRRRGRRLRRSRCRVYQSSLWRAGSSLGRRSANHGHQLLSSLPSPHRQKSPADHSSAGSERRAAGCAKCPADPARPARLRRPAAASSLGDFVGDKFVRHEIASFLINRNRILVAAAPAGTGKTALVAQLVREHIDDDSPFLVYFCELSGAQPLASVLSRAGGTASGAARRQLRAAADCAWPARRRQ